MLTFAILLGLLPGLAWLVFYLLEDTHAEPFKAIVVTFFAGALSGIVALGLQYLVSGNTASDFGDAHSIGQVSTFAFIEEACKFSVVFLLTRWARYFDEPIDAIIFPIIGALGFATLENVAVAYNALTSASIASAFQAITLRFFGATLIHTVAAATIGWWWAQTLLRSGRSYGALIGLVLAAALHAAFNILILTYGPASYTIAFIAVGIALVLFDFSSIKRVERDAGIIS